MQKRLTLIVAAALHKLVQGWNSGIYRMNVVRASVHVEEAYTCENCFAAQLYTSRLHFWERPIVLLLPVRPYRCHHCLWRGWKLDIDRVRSKPAS